jgi:DNA-binding response OmpR family regulator
VRRVLLVEDDEAIAEVVALILHESGFVVDRVSNVADALISVRGEPPAVVLLDLSLPETSGLRFLEACRQTEALASLPIVILSGTPLPALEREPAPDAVLEKPFNIEHLCTVVDRLARGAGSAAV